MAVEGANGSSPAGMNGDQSDPADGTGSGFFGVDNTQNPEDVERDETEQAEVRKLWKEVDDARKFDEPFRKQVAVDRRYAAGTSDLAWAVTTNIVGAFIDILVSLLYARDPDVSVRKSPQVDNMGANNMDMEAFARTLEIVISRLWKQGKLKMKARKGVRSVLSNAEGWFKCTMVTEKVPRPALEKELNDAQETLAELDAQDKLIADPQGKGPEEIEIMMKEKQRLIETLQAKIEQSVAKMFVIDFVPTENMQVSTDVAAISDYLDADWVGNELFVSQKEALKRFPRITAEEMKMAKLYYQRAPKDMTTRDIDNVLPQGMLTAESAQAFTTSTSNQQEPAFVRTFELWNRRDKHIYTMIDGVKAWAIEPYLPPYQSSRFYPYFYFAFYEVDGSRHAQSLSWRLYKLQDEYSATRSNYRLTRERSLPATLFNGAMIDQDQARKLSDSKLQEFVALTPTDPSVPLANIFAAKPVQGLDMRLYDPTLILNDMERISGVQEALSSAINGPGNPRTATEANIQQAGTNARTNANRDCLEEMLTELAQYTAEQALQCISIQDAQRMAGPKAFWPANMDIDDLFTLVEVQIAAGTTGKPRTGTDQQAWATILPLIKQTLGEIRQALGAGDTATAKSLIELIKETMIRMGDESDPERFIPTVPPPGSPGAGAPPPPVQPNISVSLRGEIDPITASKLVQPAVAQDAAAAAPPPPAPGAAPTGGPPGLPSPSNLAAPSPASATVPGAGP